MWQGFDALSWPEPGRCSADEPGAVLVDCVTPVMSNSPISWWEPQQPPTPRLVVAGGAWRPRVTGRES